MVLSFNSPKPTKGLDALTESIHLAIPNHVWMQRKLLFGTGQGKKGRGCARHKEEELPWR
jgi:hypothetical protein